MLTVHNLTTTSLDKLESITRRKLKKWLHLPVCATPCVLHVNNLLEVKSIREIYYSSQGGAYLSSRSKADAKVNNALDSRLNREKCWKKKSSTIVKCDDLVSKLPAEINQATLKQNKQNLRKSVHDEMKAEWSNKIKSLTLQGHFLNIFESLKLDINWKSILYHLPRNVLQFLVNSSIDTLPTNANLVRWNKRTSPKCNICPNKETLLHTLNNCKTMLDQGRYTWRHDSILSAIFEKWRSKLQENESINCDLPNNYAGISTIPSSVIVTNQRPDITVVNEIDKSIILFELTVPFDSNIENANNRKCKKYENLINDISDKGYSVTFEAFEISSRGLITNANSERLKNLLNLKNSELKDFCNQLQKTVLVSSYIIFHSKYEPEWIALSLVTF